MSQSTNLFVPRDCSTYAQAQEFVRKEIFWDEFAEPLAEEESELFEKDLINPDPALWDRAALIFQQRFAVLHWFRDWCRTELLEPFVYSNSGQKLMVNREFWASAEFEAADLEARAGRPSLWGYDFYCIPIFRNAQLKKALPLLVESLGPERPAVKPNPSLDTPAPEESSLVSKRTETPSGSAGQTTQQTEPAQYSTNTGFPGRPQMSRDLMEAEYKRWLKAGKVSPRGSKSPNKDDGARLLDWLLAEHPLSPQPALGTVENLIGRLRTEYFTNQSSTK